MKYIQSRLAVLIDCIWVAFWATCIYLMDGNYPAGYIIWFVIIGIVGLVVPWCVTSDKHVCYLCREPIKFGSKEFSDPKEKSDGTYKERYAHESCYLEREGHKQKKQPEEKQP